MNRFCRCLMPLLLLGPLAAVPGRAAEAPEPRLLTVSGQGVVRAAPDRATVTLGIEAREPTLEAARAAANRVMTALLQVTRDLGVPAAQVRSTRLAVNPEYNWNDAKHPRALLAYSVQRQLIVDLRDIDKLGELLEKSVSAGANLVTEPLLDSSRRADLERDALALAVTDARANAAVLARALDATVGAPRTVTASGGGSPPPMPMLQMARAKLAGAEAPQSYQSGELEFAASVSASFDLVAGPVAR